MKLLVRLLLTVFSVFLAYFAGLFAERFTLVPLRSGRFEANPATVAIFFAVFVCVLLLVLIVGNIPVSRHFRRSRKD